MDDAVNSPTSRFQKTHLDRRRAHFSQEQRSEIQPEACQRLLNGPKKGESG